MDGFGLGLEVEKAQTYNQVMLLCICLVVVAGTVSSTELMDDLVLETCCKIIYRAMAIIY